MNEPAVIVFEKPIIEVVYDNRKHNRLLRWFDVFKLRRRFKTLSPDFALLSAIAEFVLKLEIVYNYDNNENCEIYSLYKKTKDNSTSLFIKVPNGLIEYQLKYPNIISVQMHRETGNKLVSRWTFADGEYEIVNKEDGMLMEQIISQTMNAFLNIFERYYMM